MPTTEADAVGTDRTGSEVGRDSAVGTAEAVAAKLQALEQMDYAALRREWRRLYRAHPPKRVSGELLRLGVAWKIQEQAYGGLGAATKRRLADLAKIMERDGDVTRDRVARLKPGVRLVREWRGQTHKVIVLDDGFEWKGSHWRSLSAIAREITGGHWSGPRFFGLALGRVKLDETRAGATADE
ncbi:MAG: DUF2924 domain-containing protein [Rhodospirillales bacterium]|nr:DUF2924 domain-containing protein [Rhodospirillales bacterium]